MNTLLRSTYFTRAALGLGSLALALGLGGTAPAAGQTFTPAATAESFLAGGTAKLVTNTGCGQSTDGAHVLQVVAWDGKVPSFGWSFAGGRQTGSLPLEATRAGLTVKDPDIVSYCDGHFYMVAVYLVTVGGVDRVEYEMQAYDQTANTWNVVTGPTVVDNGSGLNCSSPNLDVDRNNGNAVLTFAEGEVYVRALNIPSQTLYPLSRVTFSTPGTDIGIQPDVAIFEDTNNPDASVVSTILVYRYTPSGPGGFTSLTLGQGTLADVKVGGTTNGIYFAATSNLYPLTHVLDWPRIAAPPALFGQLSARDCLIAVRHNNNAGGGDEIHSFSWYAANSSSLVDHTLNAPLTAGTKGSQRPVVTYMGDGGLVAWQYDDAGNALLHKDLDVLGTWINHDGSAHTLTGDLLVANAQITGNQFAPSVEGRSGATVHDGVLAWHDAARADVAYKPVHWNAPQLRLAKADPAVSQGLVSAKGVGVYPNPAVANATAVVPLAADEQAQAVQVLDSRTSRVVATLPLAGLRAGANELPLPSLSAGLYVLRVQTSQGVRVMPFSYQP